MVRNRQKVREKLKLEILFMKHCAPAIYLSIRMISPGNLYTMLYQLTKSEATSCNGFQDVSLFQVFDVHICKGQLPVKM